METKNYSAAMGKNIGQATITVSFKNSSDSAIFKERLIRKLQKLIQK